MLVSEGNLKGMGTFNYTAQLQVSSILSIQKGTRYMTEMANPGRKGMDTTCEVLDKKTPGPKSYHCFFDKSPCFSVKNFTSPVVWLRIKYSN